MEVFNFSGGVPVISTDLIDARKLLGSDKTDVIQINMKPGGEIADHITEEDVIFYILKGLVTASIGEKKAEKGKETVIPCPGGTPKGLKNTGKENASVLVIKLRMYP